MLRKRRIRRQQLEHIANTIIELTDLKNNTIIGPLTFEELYWIGMFGGHSRMDIPAGYALVIPPDRVDNGSG